jgi:hypothetical protein
MQIVILNDNVLCACAYKDILFIFNLLKEILNIRKSISYKNIKGEGKEERLL